MRVARPARHKSPREAAARALALPARRPPRGATWRRRRRLLRRAARPAGSSRRAARLFPAARRRPRVQRGGSCPASLDSGREGGRREAALTAAAERRRRLTRPLLSAVRHLVTTAGAGGPARREAGAGSKQEGPRPLPGLLQVRLSAELSLKPEIRGGGGLGIIPTLPPQGVQLSPPGRADLGQGVVGVGGGWSAPGLGSQPAAPSDSGQAERGADTPHAQRAPAQPRPGAGGGVFPGSSTAAAIYLLGFSRGREPAPALRRPPPPPASLPRGALAPPHTRTHTHTSLPARPQSRRQ